MGSYVAPNIGPAGLQIAAYTAILNYLIDQYRNIYGSTVYLAPDGADYQDLAIRALQAADVNSGLQAVYLSFNPLTATGVSLDLVGLLIGTARNQATFSTVLLTMTGTVGAVITNGQAEDSNGNFWNLPSTVTIPGGGSINVTALAVNPGSISANAATITIIAKPTADWTGITNGSAATVGEPVEPDSAYRARLLISQSKPSLTLLAGTTAAVAAVPNVTRSVVYENPNGYTASYGLVNTSGTAVTRVLGYSFDATMVTQAFTIAGVGYTVASVSDGDHLALTSSAGSQTGAAFFIGGGVALGPGHSITAVVENGNSTAIAQAIYNNKNPGVLTNGTTTVTVTDPLNGNISMPISFDILGYVSIYVSLNIHGLSPAYNSAVQAQIQAAVSTYLDSLGIGESVVFSQLYGAALSVQTNQLQPTFSIYSILSGSQAAQTTATLNSTTTIVVAVSTGIANGQTVVGTGIPPNTTVTNISGAPNIVISNAATATATLVPVSFFICSTVDIAVSYGQASNSALSNVIVNNV